MDLVMGIKKSGCEGYKKKGRENRSANLNNRVIITEGAILVLDYFNVKNGMTLNYIF